PAAKPHVRPPALALAAREDYHCGGKHGVDKEGRGSRQLTPAPRKPSQASRKRPPSPHFPTTPAATPATTPAPPTLAAAASARKRRIKTNRDAPPAAAAAATAITATPVSATAHDDDGAPTPVRRPARQSKTQRCSRNRSGRTKVKPDPDDPVAAPAAVVAPLSLSAPNPLLPPASPSQQQQQQQQTAATQPHPAAAAAALRGDWLVAAHDAQWAAAAAEEDEARRRDALLDEVRELIARGEPVVSDRVCVIVHPDDSVLDVPLAACPPAVDYPQDIVLALCGGRVAFLYLRGALGHPLLTDLNDAFGALLRARVIWNEDKRKAVRAPPKVKKEAAAAAAAGAEGAAGGGSSGGRGSGAGAGAMAGVIHIGEWCEQAHPMRGDARRFFALHAVFPNLAYGVTRFLDDLFAAAEDPDVVDYMRWRVARGAFLKNKYVP
ncbi:hypothetical protein HK405_014920, partial [Cladochytrium tenue]